MGSGFGTRARAPRWGLARGWAGACLEAGGFGSVRAGVRAVKSALASGPVAERCAQSQSLAGMGGEAPAADFGVSMSTSHREDTK